MPAGDSAPAARRSREAWRLLQLYRFEPDRRCCCEQRRLLPRPGHQDVRRATQRRALRLHSAASQWPVVRREHNWQVETYRLTEGFPRLRMGKSHIHKRGDLLGARVGAASSRSTPGALVNDGSIDIIYGADVSQAMQTECNGCGNALPASSMCAKSHSIAASTSLLPVASSAFWHRTSGKPIASSCASAAWLNSGTTGASVEGWAR